MLGAHLWRPPGPERGTVIVNCATGVQARYYHRYAAWLAARGHVVLTWDYSGIGLSRPRDLRRVASGWRDWGERDCEAVLAHASTRSEGPLAVVGHSVGGVVIGYAASAPRVTRVLTIGAQYAYWRDYAPAERARMRRRWHGLMPALTRTHGYFPGRRLGWLEDLPAGVARDFAASHARFEDGLPRAVRARVLARFAAVRAPILALVATDDPLGTEAAVRRALAYFTGADRRLALLAPADLDTASIGHFGLFHDRFATTFWPRTLAWLEGESPWASRAF